MYVCLSEYMIREYPYDPHVSDSRLAATSNVHWSTRLRARMDLACKALNAVGDFAMSS